MNSNPIETHTANILIVDDIPENLQILSATLSERGYKVRGVVKGQMAIRAAKSASLDLILLDIKMPEMDGYEVCEQLKADPKTREIPVIFISAIDEVLDKVKAFAVGGVDYITKPFGSPVLVVITQAYNLAASRFSASAFLKFVSKATFSPKHPGEPSGFEW